MPRYARMKNPDEKTCYHLISRTALDGFPFGDAEKDKFVEIIKRFSRVYFTEVLGFCIMGNHIHLVVRMLPETMISDDEIKRRFLLFYGKDSYFSETEMIPYFRNKWSDVSTYMQEIKQTFSRYYNKRHNRRGTLWGERFKSLIVQNGETLINCLSYVELNPVRAKLVSKPENYRWCSLGYHVQTGNKDKFLCSDFGVKEFGEKDPAEMLRRYRKFVYEAGIEKPAEKPHAGTISSKKFNQEQKKDFKITRYDRFRGRTRYFTDAGIIGTKEFVSEQYNRFRHLFNAKHEKIPKSIKGLDGIHSLKRLSENL